MTKSVLDLVKENVSDTTVQKEIGKVMLRYAKRNAIIQGGLLIVALNVSVYAFVQREKYKATTKFLDQCWAKSEERSKEAAEQRAIAEISQARLLECERSKKQ